MVKRPQDTFDRDFARAKREFFAAALNKALAEGNAEEAVAILGKTLAVESVAQIQKKIPGKISYTALKNCAEGGNPRVSTFLKVLMALGLRIKVEVPEDPLKEPK